MTRNRFGSDFQESAFGSESILKDAPIFTALSGGRRETLPKLFGDTPIFSSLSGGWLETLPKLFERHSHLYCTLWGRRETLPRFFERRSHFLRSLDRGERHSPNCLKDTPIYSTVSGSRRETLPELFERRSHLVYGLWIVVRDTPKIV